MKTRSPTASVRLALAVLLCAAGASGVRAQRPAATALRRDSLLTVAREIMQSSRYGAVITVDASGRPQARTVDAFPPDSEMIVWFATNPKSRKVAQLTRDPRVTLYYFDPHAPGLGYVTLLGRARLVNDTADKRKYWKPGWEALWRDRDSSLVLVEVTPERLEVVSPRYGIDGDPVTWTPPSVEFPERKSTP